MSIDSVSKSGNSTMFEVDIYAGTASGGRVKTCVCADSALFKFREFGI